MKRFYAVLMVILLCGCRKPIQPLPYNPPETTVVYGAQLFNGVITKTRHRREDEFLLRRYIKHQQPDFTEVIFDKADYPARICGDVRTAFHLGVRYTLIVEDSNVSDYNNCYSSFSEIPNRDRE